MPRKVDVMIDNALAQAGDPYVLGAEASYSDPNPKRFDCSELTSWAAARAGLSLPDGAWAQYIHCKNRNTLVSLEEAYRTRGALLFVAKGALRGNGLGNHVGFSLGNGQTIEARGRKWGVGIFNARGRSWNAAGLVPGGDYHVPPPPPPPAPAPSDAERLRQALFFCKQLVLGPGRENPPMAVMFVQTAINRHSGRGIKVDGVWGPDTAQAIIDLQRLTGHNELGFVGPQTWHDLYP